ncbi:MAG TPA: hypothetical protein VH087_08775, partial [Thermoanaerobaculia bacterium]|nr:hypothetical protein [Thermoanaerobaculia bacterium]
QVQVQAQTAAPEDSPLVAAAKRAIRSRTGKTIVITNDTLARSANGSITTTDTQPTITLPSPDAALVAMEERANQPQASTPPAQRLSPAEEDRQRRAAARAEEAGPYSDAPHMDELSIAAIQNPGSATTENVSSTQTQNPSYGTTQNPSTGQTQSPDQMYKKP